MIYVIGPEDSSIVKIGHTTNEPSFRLGNLQIGNHQRLVVRWACEGGEPLEKHLHAVFKDYRIRGEWFDFSPLGDPVQAVRAEVGEAAARQARGEALLIAERHHNIAPRPELKVFDAVPAPAANVGRASSDASWATSSWRERFPRPTGRIAMAPEGIGCTPADDREPKPLCIRAWQGRCLRPKDTTCDC